MMSVATLFAFCFAIIYTLFKFKPCLQIMILCSYCIELKIHYTFFTLACLKQSFNLLKFKLNYHFVEVYALLSFYFNFQKKNMH